MFKPKNAIRHLCFWVASMAMSCAAMAQTGVGPVQITKVVTGFASDTVGVYTDKPIINPAKCSNPDLYISDSNDPGRRTYYAAALTALASKLPAEIVVSNTECTQTGRPKIWAINAFASP